MPVSETIYKGLYDFMATLTCHAGRPRSCQGEKFRRIRDEAHFAAQDRLGFRRLQRRDCAGVEDQAITGRKRIFH